MFFSCRPTEINSDSKGRSGLRCPEAFSEIVSQRLAQGFQLIVFPKGGCSSSSRQSGAFSKHRDDLDRLFNIEPGRKNLFHHWLSIGKIFHKITYNQEIDEIVVNKNQPLHPRKDEKQEYRYRFQVRRKKAEKNVSTNYFTSVIYLLQAPDNDTYEVSWAEFKTQKLENFNWNSVDHYVITRGDKEYTLTDPQKYWRLKLHLVPHMGK